MSGDDLVCRMALALPRPVSITGTASNTSGYTFDSPVQLKKGVRYRLDVYADRAELYRRRCVFWWAWWAIDQVVSITPKGEAE